MNLSGPFIRKPVATTLLSIALALSGGIAFRYLPVSPLPRVDFPTISVGGGLPGASPENIASAIATPLERQFGRIAGVTEMTSVSSLGSTSITLQFDLDRNIDAAARDVQAAINAARAQLPPFLPALPNYRKINPADSPIMIITLTSETVRRSEIYDVASSILQQKLSQVEGVGQVVVGGGALPAVRVRVNPQVLNRYGIGVDQIRTTLNQANANRPKGSFSQGDRTWQLATTDQLFDADEYKRLIVTYRNGAAVRLSDVATVDDSVENVRTLGLAKGRPAVLLIVFRQPGANIIETVDHVRASLPQLQASISPSIKMEIANDRTTTIRASIDDVEFTLVLSVILVVFVVFLFLRNFWATFIPSIAVPLSLVGTFGAMYLLDYSLDNLSILALTISTGFVVDDAIVVLENITRYIEEGMSPMEAALKGSKEIGFTVLSMSLSLVAVFIPILMMGGLVGRLFREFAVTLSVAIAVSLVVSLTVTPMMCSRLLKPHDPSRESFFYRMGERVFDWTVSVYASILRVVLKHPAVTLLITIGTVVVNIYLFVIVPKGFFPQQDTGFISGGIQARQDISFQSMQEKVKRLVQVVDEDPAVAYTVAFAGGGGPGGGGMNTARMFITLKPWEERRISADEIIARLRRKLGTVPGASLFLQANQDIRVTGRNSNAQFQFTLRSDNLEDLNTWAPKVQDALRGMKEVVDLNSDQQNHGLEATVRIDRDTISRLGLTVRNLDDLLYDNFGQRQVSTMYSSLNQYHVVLEADEDFLENPAILKNLYATSGGQPVPIASFTRYKDGNTSLAVNHQSLFPAITLSFNLPPGYALGDAVDAVDAKMREIGLPANIIGSFQGTAQAFQDSLKNEVWLVLAALAAVYIVLGVLYESYIHPITILSTLPSAGIGALLALMLYKTELSVIALIGILLLIGIVKKNAILMIDFALDAERSGGMTPRDAIYQACLLRFRPIMMTTMAALLGGLPVALGTGTGSELRRPLGIAIVGGLIVSQALTLFTTPVVYLYLDRFRLWIAGRKPKTRLDREIEAEVGSHSE